MLARRPHWKGQLAGSAVLVLASAVRAPRTRGPLLELLGQYVFSLALREYLRSGRPELERAGVITTAGAALLLFFVPSTPWWLLTGGGPVRWLALDRFRVRVLPLGLADASLREYMRSERYTEDLRRFAPEA